MGFPTQQHPGSSIPLLARPSSFIGRAREIQTVADLLAEHRLVTLVGSPGVGKTRLALRVAAEARDQYPDGVAFVELAGLAEPELVPGAVAAALGVQDGQPILDILTETLRGRRILFAVDNCEHVIEPCAELVERLLRACPDLHILATSREALRCEGELLWRVPSLSTPALEADLGVDVVADALMSYEAVQLFVERARAVRPTFALTSQTAQTVARICARLDGIPLAIELAAARVAHLSVQQIANRLDDQFRLLTGGARTALPRQQTLEATVEWSHRLLSPREQSLLARLSVFAGGWTLEAAEAVCDKSSTDAGRGTSDTPLELLGRLVDKSLVQVEDGFDGEPRYRCLEMIRQYAFERLVEHSAVDEARRRHAEYYVGLAETAEAPLWGADYRAWFGRLDAEHDNLKAALLHAATEPGLAALALRGAAALTWFWMVRGHNRDGAYLTEQALASADDPSASPDLVHHYAMALAGAGGLALHINQFVRAAALLDRGLELATRTDDRLAAGWALVLSGRLKRTQGDYADAVRVINRSRELFRQVEEPRGLAFALYQLGAVAWYRADFDQAAPFLHESLAVFRQLGDGFGPPMVLEYVARISYNRGRYDEALELAEEHLELSRAIGYRWGIGFSLVTLGMVANRRGDVAQAIALFQESLTVRRDMGEREGIAECLERLSGVAVASGQSDSAARLLGVAEALRGLIAAPVPLAGRADYERDLSAVHASLDDASLAARWAEGRAMTLEQGIAEARAIGNRGPAIVPAAAPSAAPPGANRTSSPHPLTQREWEVASLIALGLSNREIAARLVVSKRTVDAHMASILARLGFANRAQVAVWAAELRQA